MVTESERNFSENSSLHEIHRRRCTVLVLAISSTFLASATHFALP